MAATLDSVARLDYGWLRLRPVQNIFGGLGVLLLIAVFIPGLGMRLNGASRWVHGLGQPSEFVKPLVVALLALWSFAIQRR